jgi:hypothetical protein
VIESAARRQPTQMKKRMGYLKLHEEVPLDKVGLSIRAYGKQDNFLGRVEINRAGLAAYVGTKGRKRLGNLSWEKFFERMGEKKKKKE